MIPSLFLFLLFLLPSSSRTDGYAAEWATPCKIKLPSHSQSHALGPSYNNIKDGSTEIFHQMQSLHILMRPLNQNVILPGSAALPLLLSTELNWVSEWGLCIWLPRQMDGWMNTRPLPLPVALLPTVRSICRLYLFEHISRGGGGEKRIPACCTTTPFCASVLYRFYCSSPCSTTSFALLPNWCSK